MEQILDITLLVALGGFALYGFAAGFVQALASLAGLVFSVFVAARSYVAIAQWVFPSLIADRAIVQTIVFFLILVLITSLVNVLVRVIDKVFHVIAIIPFTKSLNRLLGCILGLLIGVLAIAATLFAAQQLPGLPEAFVRALEASSIAHVVLLLSGIVQLLFPEVLTGVREAVGSGI